MAGYYIRDGRSFDTCKILDTLKRQNYTRSGHCFDGIIHDSFPLYRNVVIYDDIIRPIYCSDESLENYIRCVENFKEIFIQQDKVFLGAV